MDFKPIRNQLCKYSYESLVPLLLDILKKQEGHTQTPSPFWHPLLLLRWSMEFAGNKYPAKTATGTELNKIFKLLDELEMAHPTFNLKKNGRMSKTFTILSFQQFQYQERPWFNTFERQYILYTQLRGDYDIAKSFHEKTGLTIAEILSAFKLLWMSILHNAMPEYRYDGTLTNDHLSMISDLIGVDQLNKLISLLAISRDNIKRIIESDTRLIRDYNLQVFEISIFTQYPFFIFNNNIILPHRDILNHTINHYIYDFMKSRDGRFSEDLGKRMEKYIELGLKENQIEFKNETTLRNLIGKENKVVDFLIEDDILLECKAIELRPYANINPTDDILSTELAKTITKAYAKQMLGVANRLKKHSEYYGIIVTYKKLNLGETDDIWDQFLKSETFKLISDTGQADILPKENLFFIDLSTWDLVMQIVKSNKLSIKDLLLNIKLAKERKFGFYMHLDEYGVKRFDLDYLRVDHPILGN